MKEWLAKEEELGSPNPSNIVLATAGKDGIPHSRIVAIREVTEAGILFFTQSVTRKVQDLAENPHGSMTLWLPMQQSEIIIEGGVKALSKPENEHYWNMLPYDRKLRFFTYAPTSNQPIHALSQLEEKHAALSLQYDEITLPICPFYCGFRLLPQIVYFYTLGKTTFSAITKYTLQQGIWQTQILSP